MIGSDERQVSDGRGVSKVSIKRGQVRSHSSPPAGSPRSASLGEVSTSLDTWLLCALHGISLSERSFTSVFSLPHRHHVSLGHERDATALDITVYWHNLAAMLSVTDWLCQEKLYVHLSFPRYQYVSLRSEEGRTTAADCENLIL